MGGRTGRTVRLPPPAYLDGPRARSARSDRLGISPDIRLQPESHHHAESGQRSACRRVARTAGTSRTIEHPGSAHPHRGYAEAVAYRQRSAITTLTYILNVCNWRTQSPNDTLS